MESEFTYLLNFLTTIAFFSFPILLLISYWKKSMVSRKGKESHHGIAEGFSSGSKDLQNFMKEYSGDYGYSSLGFSLLDVRSFEFSRLKDDVYLDFGGSSMYGKSQIESISNKLLNSKYGNPHSQSEMSKFSSNEIQNVRNKVLAMFDASPREYLCVFTSGATSAFKCVGENFDWSEESIFMHSVDNHNSVLGIREYALSRGSTVKVVDFAKSHVAAPDSPHNVETNGAEALQVLSEYQRMTNGAKQPFSSDGSPKQTTCHLFAFPSESNFSGEVHDLNWVKIVQARGQVSRSGSTNSSRWFVLLDAAKSCSTHPPNLSKHPADFVGVSFYKIFGYPTGIGALIIRKDAVPYLKKAYFGGGAVEAVSPLSDFSRLRDSAEASLEDGTVSFIAISSLLDGFHFIERFGFPQISRHTACLTHFLAQKLTQLRHSNGQVAIVLYGKHSSNRANYGLPSKPNPSQSRAELNEKGRWVQGPVVCFNVKRADGSFFGFKEVERVLGLCSIHIRTGCFCNPGACSKYLGISDLDFKQNHSMGHKCWDDHDIVGSRPMGAVRVSFGYFSAVQDALALIGCMERYFIEGSVQGKSSRHNSFHSPKLPIPAAISPPMSVTNLFIYPVKSCAAMEVQKWPFGDSGFLFDREWLIVDLAGNVLTQKKFPSLALIQPIVDLERRQLILSCPKLESRLSIPLAPCPSSQDKQTVKVCGKSKVVECSGEGLSEWLSSAVGTECSLARSASRSIGVKKGGLKLSQVDLGLAESINSVNLHDEGQFKANLVNDGQFLLVSQRSVEDLRSRIDAKKLKGLTHQQFRPNMVISGDIPFAEDNWKSILIGGVNFLNNGGCARCDMINIDQSTGTKSSKEPLLTLASYRRNQGRILFGIFVTVSNLSIDFEGADQIQQVEVLSNDTVQGFVSVGAVVAPSC